MSKKAFIFLVSGLIIAFGFLIVQAAPTFQASPTIASSSGGIILQGTPTHYLSWTSYDGNASTASYAVSAGTATNAANSNQVDGYDLNQALTIGASPSFGLLTATAGLTVTGAAINLNAASNFPVNIATGASTGAINIGGGSNTLNIATSDWDITTAGVMTGISGITNDGAYTQTGTSVNTFTGTSTLSVLLTNGNVGVKTTTPAQALHVVGYARADSGFCIGTTCITTWPSGAVASVSNSDSTLTVSPTTGAVVASLNLAHANTWTAAQTFSANTNFPGSGIWDTTGNVGIGTAAPVAKLQINGNATGEAILRFVPFANGNFSGIENTAAAGGAALSSLKLNASTGEYRLYAAASYFPTFYANGAEVMRINTAGNVGIGTTTPLSRLQLGNTTSGLTASPESLSLGGTYSNTAGANPKIKLYDTGSAASYYGLGVSSSQMDFMVPAAAGFSWFINGSELATINASGNLGIGTITPTQKLDVNGYIALQGKNAFKGYDSWLRINEDNAFASGIYAGAGILRTDGVFQVGGNGSTFIVASTGNVGIGTTTPAHALEVNNDAQVNGLTVGRGAGNIATNAAFGVSALAANTTGYYNTAIGYNTLPVNTTGYQNTAIGMQSLYSNQGGLFNTAVGFEALYSNRSGQSNVAIGFRAMHDNQFGSENTAIGQEALDSILINDSNYNVAVGRYAGSSITGGMTRMTVADRSVFIGYATMAQANGQTNQNVIGYGTTGAGSNTTTIGNTNITMTILRGDVYGGAFIYSSDRNLKTNIKPLDDSLAKILKLRGVTFNWKKNGKPSVGLIAQEVEKVFPELVTGEEGNKGVSYGNLVAPLIEAVKEQQKEIDSLEARIKVLESKKK